MFTYARLVDVHLACLAGSVGALRQNDAVLGPEL